MIIHHAGSASRIIATPSARACPRSFIKPSAQRPNPSAVAGTRDAMYIVRLKVCGGSGPTVVVGSKNVLPVSGVD
jgi:hypothetical protein